MRRSALLMVISACLVLCSEAFAEYRTVEERLLRLTIDSDWASQVAPGYLPVRFDVTNLGDDRVIEIAGHGMRWSRYLAGANAEVDVRQTLRLKKGDRLRFTIPVPVFAENESIQFQIFENGDTVTRF